MLKQLSGPILILGSKILCSQEKPCYRDTEEKLSSLFPYTIDINPPEDNTEHGSRKSKLEEDMKAIEFQDNRNDVSEILSANDVECDDLGSISFGDTLYIEIGILPMAGKKGVPGHIISLPTPRSAKKIPKPLVFD